jgi:predicted ATPase
MRLAKVRVTEFHSVHDSNEFEVGDVTCLVGKNEAGKTAILQALYRLNPLLPKEGVYNVTDDYPRWNVEDYQIDVEAETREPAIVARAQFTLESADLAVVEQVFGDKVMPTPTLTISKGYEGTLYYDMKVDQAAAVRHLIETHDFGPEALTKLTGCNTLVALAEVLQPLDVEPAAKLKKVLPEYNKNGLSNYIFNKLLVPRIPKFLYFDEYYQMVGCANIDSLKQRKQENRLEKSDHPLLGLVNLARLDLNELQNPSRTRELKNALEGAGNHLTKKVVKYWSQNRYLQLRFDVRAARPQDPAGMTSGTNIWGDVYDSKHYVTTELGTRSRGFVWFFSFLAWYGDVLREDKNVILLLDEPGLSLHAKAQGDLLRYFDAEVQHQLLYTTHSPFMVDPARFDRVRIVQDLSIDTDEELPPETQGTKVIDDVLEATEDSLFPLQGALGYEIHQTLFVGPNNLVIEGVSDLLHLDAMRAVAEGRGRVGLHRKWTLTPVGGSDKVPTFVALIGGKKGLNVAVLVDYQKKDKQTIENLYKKKLLQKKKVLTYADFTGTVEADVEDMFEPDFYLRLVNEAFASDLSAPITMALLDKNLPRITAKLEKYFEANPLKGKATWNHTRPARYLLTNLSKLESDISDATIGRFETAFKKLNELL